MKRISAFVVLALLAVLVARVALAQSGYDLFQQALVKERAEGKLEEAIQIYQRIVQEYASNRALAAKALVQMGQCYEKLGKTEARKAYERVVRDYSDQPEMVAEARARLAALNHTGKATEMVTRRIWTGPDADVSGSPSPDGRYLSYTDWDTGDLAVRDLATGKTRRLTNGGSSWTPAGFSVISPDGKEVAYNWFSKDGFTEGLRLLRLDGSAPRILYSEKGVLPFRADWSPDGKYILTSLFRDANSIQIALVSVADGSVRVLKTLDRIPGKVKFSPDGRYIAYDFPQQKDSDSRDIFLLAADGSREIRLVEHSANDVLLGWTPDGNYILFASDRSGSMSAWVLRVADGKPQGSPELVKQDIGQAVPIGFTRAGAFYYGLAIGTSDVYTAEFDPATGRVLTQPQNATQRFVGSNSSPAWSPDGQYLAYISQNRPWFAAHRPKVISIRSLKTGEERDLDLSTKLTFIWGPIRWSPDGRSILVPGKDRKYRHGFYLIDAQSGEVTPVLGKEADLDVSGPAWFPDGKTLLYMLYTQGESGTTTETILIRDLETGRETELFRSTPGVKIDDIALSPDGRQVALTLVEQETRSSMLKVLPVTAGEARELLTVKEPETVAGGSLTWSSDSRYIVFGRGRASSNEPKTELFAISPRGGEPHALGLAMDFVRDVSFHPDGRHLAFAASAGKDKIEVWVMENFLPRLKAAK